MSSLYTIKAMAPPARASKRQMKWSETRTSKKPRQAPRGVKMLIKRQMRRIMRLDMPPIVSGVAVAMPSGMLCRPIDRGNQQSQAIFS